MNTYLLELFKERNTIIIPGLGALTITDKETGEVMFMPYLIHDDGKLARFIAAREGIDEAVAKVTLSKYVRELKSILDSGMPYHMQGLGVFEKADDGDIQFRSARAEISQTGPRSAKKSFPRKIDNELRFHLETIQRKYYAVGAKWEEDKLETFLEQEIWENGDDKLGHVVEKVRENDVLVVKSTYPGKNTGILRVKYLGIVTKNYNNGRKLDVMWIYNAGKVDISGRLSKLRHRIAEIELHDFIEIIEAINDIEGLYQSGIFERPPSKVDMTEVPLFKDGINIENSSSTLQDSTKDKIPFHLDSVENIDRLNREPVAKSLARLINEDVFDRNPNHSFIIHLQGAWGSGKSTFLNLLEKHLETDKRKWIVVKYNAWQHQHINPPWWSFIDQIYRQSKAKLKTCQRLVLKYFENKRRILKYGQWQKALLFILFITCVVLLIVYGKSLLELANRFPSTVKHNEQVKGISLEIFAKMITSIAAAIGTVYSISKFVASPFLMTNSSEAESFVQRSSDPMQTIKSHFEGLIYDINDANYEVAVFIDDLDRCNGKYTVELLEGIQTLFKDKRVLYVIAGDKDWIATCFEKNYAEFNRVVGRDQKLGELFLEKAFQLSIRLPQMSDSSRKKYWNYIIGNPEENRKETIAPEARNLLKNRLREISTSQGISKLETLTAIENEFETTEDVVSDVMLEVLDENQNDIQHLLSTHHDLIVPNPRAIIRLANEYTMFRNILWSERIQFSSDILFRWIIISSSFPIIASRIRSNISIIGKDEFKSLIEKLDEKEKFEKLFFDREEKYGGKMEIDQLSDILGDRIDSTNSSN